MIKPSLISQIFVYFILLCCLPKFSFAQQVDYNIAMDEIMANYMLD